MIRKENLEPRKEDPHQLLDKVLLRKEVAKLAKVLRKCRRREKVKEK